MHAQNRPNPGRTGDANQKLGAVEPLSPLSLTPVGSRISNRNNLGTDGLDHNEVGFRL